MSQYADYQAFCDRVCSYVMSYELGIPFQWDTPLPLQGNRGPGILRQWNAAHPEQVEVRYLKLDDPLLDLFDPFLDGDVPLLVGDKRRYKEGVEHLRLTVTQRHIHYYQRTPAGDEDEIQLEGTLSWLPSIPEHLCSPATEEQLQAAEALLGFPLPSPLRELYQHVANGGFGPTYEGLFALPGCEDQELWLLTDQYIFQKANCQLIDLSICERRAATNNVGYTKYLADWEIFVPQGYWPDRLLPLAHDGCALFYYLDVPTGRVFFAGDDYLALRLMANSLEELFNRWMHDDLFDYRRFREESRQKFGKNFVDPFPDRGV